MWTCIQSSIIRVLNTMFAEAMKLRASGIVPDPDMFGEYGKQSLYIVYQGLVVQN